MDLENYILAEDIDEDDDLVHYGTKRHSGRYPWGSGENPYQHDGSFMARYDELKAAGLTRTQMADAMGIPTTYFDQKRAIEMNRIAQEEYSRILKLKEHGYSNSEIAKKMGYASESTVRSKIKIAESGRLDRIDKIADAIRASVDSKGYIDIGKGVNYEVNCNANEFSTAVTKLIEEGYEPFTTQVEQLGTGHRTELKVLGPKGTTYKQFKDDVGDDLTKIKSITDYFEYDDNGNFVSRGVKPPAEFSSKRLAVRYGDQELFGVKGVERDGLIELRRGVDDISLGGANYAQVRINVDGTHYLKGMAVYSDNLPDGVDILFNTNKKTGTPILGDGKENSVLKKLKDDPNNPFGASIKSEELDARSQRMYKDPVTGEMKQSVINLVNGQGDWDSWSRNLPAQFLSKQSLDVADKQLKLDIADRKLYLEEIQSISNPTIRKHYLDDFAETCDAAASDLKAAAFPRQASKVLLPIPSLKKDECYAPDFENGTTVALVRFPHEGTFQIPVLKVNNKNKEAISTIGNNAKDAIGIGAEAAEKLSGADFDGDTVIAIPLTDKVKIKSDPLIKELQGYDAKDVYKGYPGMEVMKEKTKQTQMGVISNLITDMTLQGADEHELARAVRHSQCVIDAVKHELDYRRSYEENGIAELKEKYQKDPVTGKVGGASTLISRAGAEKRVPERKEYYKVDPETGEKIYTNTNRVYELEVDKYVPKNSKDGKEVYRKKKGAYEKEVFNYETGETETKMVYTKEPTTKVKAMDLVKDANDLITIGHPMEKIYANYANTLKAMANEARKESLVIKSPRVNKSAEEVYKDEIDSLNYKVTEALKNAPRERQAQVIANQRVNEKIATNPQLKDDKDKLKKIRNSELLQARSQVGASKKDVEISISPKEWEAIQAGAVGSTMLKTIIANSNKDVLKSLVMPKTANIVSPAKANKAKAMANSGWTIADIADSIGLSTSTVSKLINE
ncbi:MAG TPA: phage tail protein [Eubacterium sp.]|nr:phage tail protein [Eubacterium sp.]